MIRTAALALAFLALTAGDAQVSAPPGNAPRPLARDHAAPEAAHAFAKAPQPWPQTSAASGFVLATERLGSITGRGTRQFQVVVVPGLALADLAALEESGAVGLLVPGAGPETSEELARAGLERGEARNSLRGGSPPGDPLLEARTGALGSADGPAIYVGLPEGDRQANDRRYPIVVVGRGYEGVLTSESTRIPGLVSIVDVAPTALGTDGALGWETEENGAAELAALDERIDDNNRTRLWAVFLTCALLLLLALVRPPAAVPALATLLLANLALGLAGVSAAWAVLLVLGLAVLAGASLPASLRRPLALGFTLAGVLAAYLLVLGLDGAAVALSPLGPTQNARFYGLSNLLETFLLVPALGGAALLGSRLGRPAFAAVAVLALVTVAGSSFGADGGGAVVLAAGFVTLALLASSDRRRALVLAPLAAVAAVILVLVIDLAAGTSSHVTEAVGEGPVGLAGDLRDRVVLSYERITADWYVALVVTALFAAFALLVTRTLARRGLAAGTALPLALAVALGASLAVNDSPLDVLLVGAVAYLAADRGMLAARWPGPSRSRSSSLPSSWPRDAAAARPPRPSRKP
jgi:hypothetical protein